MSYEIGEKDGTCLKVVATTMLHSQCPLYLLPCFLGHDGGRGLRQLLSFDRLIRLSVHLSVCLAIEQNQLKWKAEGIIMIFRKCNKEASKRNLLMLYEMLQNAAIVRPSKCS